MPNDKLHIIITGEHDKSYSLALPKQRIRQLAVGVALLFLFLAIGTIQGGRYFKLKSQNDNVLEQLALTQSNLHELSTEKSEITKKYEQQIAALKQEKEHLLANSISELDERSKVIQTVMANIGVDIGVEEDQKHSGGPYLQADDQQYTLDLLYKTDRYLDIFNKIPLGRPVPGSISSRYGYRNDPLLNKRAFHSGIDFRGKSGEEIHTTGYGVVKRATYNKGLGNYVLITHGNGYETLYGHMKKLLVKKGDTVKRGQAIGLVGSTGRSTGSHLHYEIRLNKKTVNPKRYLKVADLSVKSTKNNN